MDGSIRLSELIPSKLVQNLSAHYIPVGTIGLTPSEKTLLSEPTSPTPKDPNTYPVMIQVFHNIHCLNLIRKAVWRDFYPDALDMLPDGSANRTSPKALHIGEEPTFVRK